jgi:hypothetical protein
MNQTYPGTSKAHLDVIATNNGGNIPVWNYDRHIEEYDNLFTADAIRISEPLDDLRVANGYDRDSPYAKRLIELFKPRLNDIESDKPGDEYDALFGADEDLIKWQSEKAMFKSEQLVINSETLEAARIAYENCRQSIKDIAYKTSKDKPLDSIAIVEEIRNNPHVRLALGEYFINELWNLKDKLPDRVQRNTQKRPNHVGGYHWDYTSFEYVALLCLSMLDGTYDPAKESSDPVVENNGSVTLGQHRYSAKLLLGLENKSYKL